MGTLLNNNLKMQRYNAHPIQYNVMAPGPDEKLQSWDIKSGYNANAKGYLSLLLKYRTELITWGAFGLVSISLGFFFSDLTFSAIATLASAFQILSYLLIHLKIHATGTVNSLSQETLTLTVCSLFLRLISTTQFNGYLPVDKSGDWLIQACDALCLLLVTGAIFLSRTTYQSTIPYDQDSLLAIYMIPLAIIISPFIKANLNHHWLADNCWMTSLLIETFANMPQVVLLSQQDDEVEILTGHFLASQGISKILALVFWASSYRELIVAGSSALSSGAIIACYGIQTVVLGDFLYYYFRSLSNNTRIVINDIDML